MRGWELENEGWELESEGWELGIEGWELESEVEGFPRVGEATARWCAAKMADS